MAQDEKSKAIKGIVTLSEKPRMQVAPKVEQRKATNSATPRLQASPPPTQSKPKK